MDNKRLAIAFALTGLFIVVFSYFLLFKNNTDDSRIAKIEEVPLTEFQITACNAAEAGGQCEARLPKLKIVSASDCCKYLNKCCKK